MELLDFSHFLFAFAWFIAGFVNSVCGMGAAMVALPIVVGTLSAQTLVPATCICVGIISIAMSCVYWRATRWHSFRAMAVGAVPGAAAGCAILLVLPISVLELTAGILMVLFVIWQFCRKIGEGHGDGFITGCTSGFFAGFINTSIGFGNPPVAIYSIWAGWTQAETLGSMNVFTGIVCCITAITHAAAGLYSFDVFSYALFGGPATVLGMIAGLPVARRVKQDVFKRILLIVIACAGFICIWRGLSEILFK